MTVPETRVDAHGSLQRLDQIPMPNVIQVILVDASEVLRTGIRVVLQRIPHIKVVGEASTLGELREQLALNTA